MSPMGWKLPFNLAILFHVLLLSSALIIPKYIHTRTKLPDFTSVDLITIADMRPAVPAATPPPASVPAQAVKNKPEKVTATKVIPLAEIAEASPVATPAKAISIKPLKRKIKKKVPKGLSTEEVENQNKALIKQQALEARSQELQKEAKRQKAIAEAEAKIAASDALTSLKQSLRADANANNTKATNRTGSSGGRSSALEAQYFSSIFGHLHQYWSLPEIKQWDSQLTAIVIITIAQDGHIMSHSFEKRSGDRVFDQFVSRTIQDANPLPPIPRALKEQQYTLGLRFKPGQIQ